MNDTDALTKALVEADSILDRCRKGADSSSLIQENSPSFRGQATARMSAHREQYKHFKDWVYVAIKAIAQRIAGQPIYVGRKKRRPSKKRTATRRDLKSFLDTVDVIENHPLLDLIEDPNEIFVRFSLLFSTVASLGLTGKSFWVLADSDRGRPFDLWPLPAFWVSPQDALQSAWLVRPQGIGEPYVVPGERMAYFHLPDPGDPFNAVSPLQTQAGAVDSDEALQRSQAMAFHQGVFPSVAITCGTLDGTPTGPKVRMTNAQAKQLTNAVMQRYAG